MEVQELKIVNSHSALFTFSKLLNGLESLERFASIANIWLPNPLSSTVSCITTKIMKLGWWGGAEVMLMYSGLNFTYFMCVNLLNIHSFKLSIK